MRFRVGLQDGSLYAADSPPYFDEYPFSMPPDPYLLTRPSDEELVVSQINFGYDAQRSGECRISAAVYLPDSASNPPCLPTCAKMLILLTPESDFQLMIHRRYSIHSA